MIAALTLLAKAPVISLKRPGIKTAFVRCEPNWPNAGLYPNIAADILLDVQQRYGDLWTRDFVSLPACGWSSEFCCDELIVDAEYKPAVSTATPYPSYRIVGGICVGDSVSVATSRYIAIAGSTPTPYLYPATSSDDLSLIPSFSTEFRVLGGSTGTIHLLSVNPSGICHQRNSFESARDWTPILSSCYRWRAIIGGIPNPLEAYAVLPSLQVEFR
jgi:hypothetical protein